jgi:hypothetical protein
VEKEQIKIKQPRSAYTSNHITVSASRLKTFRQQNNAFSQNLDVNFNDLSLNASLTKYEKASFKYKMQSIAH